MDSTFSFFCLSLNLSLLTNKGKNAGPNAYSGSPKVLNFPSYRVYRGLSRRDRGLAVSISIYKHTQNMHLKKITKLK
jgi:hypothetical protein